MKSLVVLALALAGCATPLRGDGCPEGGCDGGATDDLSGGVGLDGGCLAPLLRCAGTCVDPMVSAINCGTCGHACSSGQACEGGACTCTPTSCPGCCDGDTCRPGTDDNACGTGGAICNQCSGHCMNMACGACTPGQTQMMTCGQCGAMTRSCDQAGTWGPYGSCMNEGPCAPGDTRTMACGNCGMQTDTCSAQCQWTAGQCMGAGPCAPNAMQLVACGNCGSQAQLCSNACQWTNSGMCMNQGACKPGATRTMACGNCGTETDTCSNQCAWVAGNCAAQGACAPGAKQLGNCDVCQEQTCSNQCAWGPCALKNGNACTYLNGTHTRSCTCNGGCAGSALQWCLNSCQWSMACACCTNNGCVNC